MKRIVTTYVSELDQFLVTLNETCAQTKAQQAEIKKADRLALLRDSSVEQLDKKSSLWDGF